MPSSEASLRHREGFESRSVRGRVRTSREAGSRPSEAGRARVVTKSLPVHYFAPSLIAKELRSASTITTINICYMRCEVVLGII